ncbi:hypothetical protein AB0D67_19440 [Streptosporangium sp. NPDC048047]|uniref:hypothetical protein n=1 Tax=Streptosporangium sp. NPDC048047 TaxID=3155748 RepID=UPI00341CF8E0
MNWNLALSYLQTLIWPMLIVALALVFRHPLARLVGRLRKAGAAGVEVEFEQAEEALRQADTALEVTSTPDTEPPNESPQPIEEAKESRGGDVDRWPDPQRPTPPSHDDRHAEANRRKAIENVLAEGIRLGWEYAKYGESAPPKFGVEWTSSGTPRIIDKSAEAGQRIKAAQEYKARIGRVLSRQLKESETLLKEGNSWFGPHDYVYQSDSGEIWIAIEYDLDSNVDLIHRLHETFSSQQRYLAKKDTRLLGIIFIHHRKAPARILNIIKMLWTADHSHEVQLVRWTDSSDDYGIIEAVYSLDDSYIPF